MRLIKVNVTQGWLIQGKRYEPCACPVALALQEHFPARTTIMVEPFSVFALRGEDCKVIPMPPELVKFVQDFDRGKPVVPQEFLLTCDDGAKSSARKELA